MSSSSGPPPGWYRAADGRWYPPPQQRYGPPPQQQYGPQQLGPQQYGPPPTPPPVPRRRGPGRALLVVGAVVLVLVVLGAIALNRLVTGIGESVDGLAGGTDCAAVSTEAVDTALGGTYDVVELGALGALAAPVLDSRVLADAPSCWAVESGDTGGRLARIARYSGPDAAERFAAEKAAAMGTSEDRGGGITVSSAAYFNKDVAAGDEAFCTTGDFTASAGVLVRTGDLLVYVSTTAAGDGAESIPDIDFDQAGGASDAIRFGTDDANCDRAVALAAQVR